MSDTEETNTRSPAAEADMPERLDLHSQNVAADKQAELLELYPEVRTEGGKIDFDRLRAVLGEVVDAGKERYGMTWPGKAECLRTIQAPSLGTLRPCPEDSVNFDTSKNLIIEGDNLEVLKLLQKSYLGKIKMIYIDPPYNTGNDFIYPDNYTESLQTYLEYTGQVDDEGKKFSTNSDSDGRFHSKWLNMIYPRLYLARNLLRDDGIAVISIDDNEIKNLRELCGEVFGEENFLGQVTVQSNPRGRQSDAWMATVHDYLLIYARAKAHCVVGGSELTDSQRAEFSLTDENGSNYRLLGLRQRGSASRRQDRPDMFFPLYVNPDTLKVSTERSAEFTAEVLPRKSTGEDGRWMWGQAKVSRDIQDVQAKYIERRKEFDIFVRDHLERNGEDRTRKFKTIWDDKGFNTQNGTQEVKAILGSDAMPFPKPVALLEAIIRFGVPGDGIVLDYFAGSGTTAQAVLERNELDGKDRQFILVQLPEPTDREDYRTIADIGKERLRLVIDKLNNEDVVALPLNEEAPRDRGFRVFKLSESNFATWEAAGVEKGSLPEQLAIHVEHVREDRSQQDLLFEILLKIGFDLTTMATAESIEGQTVYSIASGALMVCLSRSINLELIREVAKRAPERFVCLDEGFAGNDQLKVNAVQIFKSKNVVFKTV